MNDFDNVAGVNADLFGSLAETTGVTTVLVAYSCTLEIVVTDVGMWWSSQHEQFGAASGHSMNSTPNEFTESWDCVVTLTAMAVHRVNNMVGSAKRKRCNGWTTC